MATNILMQNSATFNGTSKMDSINGNIVIDSDKSVVKSETNDDSLSNLMEKLHAKANQMKSWTDLAKIMKQSVNEKRHIIDINERNQLQKCLDTIQKNIRVTSLQSMVERLETICRQLGLKFSVPPQVSPKRVECFVHSEMYYVEVLLEAPTGNVLDCKVAHQAEALSCAELTDVLQKGDFVEFTKHLEGLSAIYQINADKKNKTKAYLALHALEVDLSSLAELQNHQINDINNLVHKSPVGILEPRKGGHPMRLTYFVPPYDLIDLTTKSSLPLNVDIILEKGLGFSATICIESSSSHRLQHESLINTLKTPEGKNLPQFSALTALNSTQLPACFVLKLQKPLVTSLDILKKIRADTNIEFNHELINKSEPIIQLIAKQLLTSKKDFQANGPFYVKLPNQSHCYHLNEDCDKLDGVVITSIPITHPTHVPRILVHLRQQVLFNVIIGSFIRQTIKTDVSNIFEVTTTSMSNINIQFEHPTEESLATLDLDLRDVTNVKCKLYPTSSLSSFCSDDFASKVMQRCLSIPVTMRSIINKCKERAAALKEQMAREQPSQTALNQNELYFSSLNSSNGSLDPGLGGRQQSLQYLSQTLQQYNGTQSAQLQQQMNQQFVAQNNSLQGQQQNLQRFLAQKMQHQLNTDVNPQNRPQMTLQQFQQQQELLQQNQLLGQNGSGQKHNTMLMSMLSDIPAANSQMALNLLKQQQQQQHLQQQIQLQQHLQFMQQRQQQQSQQKPKKQRKRKITSDNLIRSPGSSAGKSPKRKLSDDDFSRELPEDSLGVEAYQWGNDGSNIGRPSSTPSSTASFAETIGNIKQELNMSGGATPTSGGNDTLNSFSYMNSRHPFENNQNDFNDFNASELPLYGESGGEVMTDIKPSLSLDMSLISAKNVNKRTTKRMKSDASDDASGTGDEGHNEQLKIIKSLEDLHQKDSFSKFFAKDSVGIPENSLKKTVLNNIKVAKTSNKSDVRRCSSAGIESGSEQKRTTNLGLCEDITEVMASLKKERKRKRAESVDSLKASAIGATSTTGRNPINSSNMCSESSMMPPPMTSSIGDVTSSSCLSLIEGNQQKLISNIKMSPTSSTANAGPSPSQTVMKISSSGKKSLIGSSVSSTSGNETKLSKSLTNKLDKSSTLSSMLKNQKHNYTVSPKIDAESSSSLTPSLSLKTLTFKTSKSKASKSGLNSSPGRTKEYNKSQVVSGTKQKSGNISSTSALSGSKSGSTAVSSSSSLSPGLSSSTSSSMTSVSSSKQQTAKVAKISRKSSLTAVVDRLHQKQDATGVPTGQPGAPIESGRPESSSLSTNRPDTTSTPKVSQSGSNKTTEPKAKYSRTSDQFTIKQSNSGGGLKMSITKTKLSATDNSNKIGPGGTGLFKTTATSKFTIPKLPKAASAPRPISTSTSPSATTTTSGTPVSSNPSVRRQINPKITGNIRTNVSSSTHPTGPSVSPKGSSIPFNASHNKPSFVERHNLKTSPNQLTTKSPSLTKGLTEKFKSSEPTSTPTSTTKGVHSTDALLSSSNNFGVSKPIAETTRPPVYSKFDGVTLPMPVGYSRSLSASAGNVSPQLPASTTSSLQTNKPIFTKSLSVNEAENVERMLSNWGQTHEMSAPESGTDSLIKNIPSNKNMDNISSPQNKSEKPGVSSSSDVKASTSTPSSPAEMALISDALQNPPPLIPIEAIDDSNEGGSGGSASIETNVECENSTQITLDSTELSRDCRPSAPVVSESIPSVSANEISNEVSTSENKETEKVETEVSPVSQSRLSSQVVSESNKMIVEEDEDGDGLVIDDPSVVPKSNRGTASNIEAVSSSTSRLNIDSQNIHKLSTSPTSSSTTPIGASHPVLALTSMASFGSVTSPSNHSTNSSIQRPSPYPIADIDDELMDEALVGSNE